LPRYKGREVNFPKVRLAATTWFALLLFASCNPEVLSRFEVWWMRDEDEEECSMEQARGLAHLQAAKPRSTLKQHICFALDHEYSEETTIKDIDLETIKS